MPGPIRRRFTAAALTAGLALAFLGAAPSGAIASTNAGAVYVLSNQTAGDGGNSVLVFSRAADGTLSPSGSFSTGGDGTGGGLGDQGALVLRGDRLFAVSAGSNQITSFAVSTDGLTLTKIKKVSSGGTTPISVAVFGSYVYVLNAGGAGNITGFVGANSGNLKKIGGSARPLSASSGTGPAQISFAAEGDLLVVTEKATNLIDTYTVNDDGLATGPSTHASNGSTPFGFAVRKDRIIVSEAAGGAAGASTISSYRLASNGTPTTGTASLSTGQSAVCWVVIARHTRFAYATNTGNGTITGLRLREDNSVSLLDPSGVTATTDAGPIDLAVSVGSGFLYSLNAGGHSIGAFELGGDGSLSAVAGATGLPSSAVGLAAR